MARKIGPQQDLDIDKLEAEHGDIWGSELSKESFISMVEEVIQETEERHVEVGSRLMLRPYCGLRTRRWAPIPLHIRVVTMDADHGCA